MLSQNSKLRPRAGTDTNTAPGYAFNSSSLSSRSSGPSIRSGAGSDVPEAGKHPLYKQWLDSGKPHNVICSKCYGPNDLLLCESCCRAYHELCLPAANMPTTVRFGFQCPACMAGRWDYAPSKPGSLTSPEASRIASPSTVSGIVTPAGKTANTGHLTPIAQLLTHGPPFTPDHGVPVDAFDPSILSRARDFLRANGDFPESQEYSVELLIKLGGMMSELDFHRRRTQELLSENAHLRQDNANIRAYLDSNLVTGKPSAPVSDLSHIPRPSSDTTGKSWDRIVMDLI